MPRTIAGLLMYRFREEELQVLLAHPGGPFFKNAQAWTILPPFCRIGLKAMKQPVGVTPVSS